MSLKITQVYFLRVVHYRFAFFLIAAVEPLSKVVFVVVVPMATLAVVGVTAPAPIVVEDLLYPAC